MESRSERVRQGTTAEPLKAFEYDDGDVVERSRFTNKPVCFIDQAFTDLLHGIRSELRQQVEDPLLAEECSLVAPGLGEAVRVDEHEIVPGEFDMLFREGRLR